jgi:Zn ribbon nucleic-acid-binding protein
MPKTFNAQEQPQAAKVISFFPPKHKKPAKIDRCCAWCDAKDKDTAQWRSGPNNSKLCNRCGLHYRRIKQELIFSSENNDSLFSGSYTENINNLVNNPMAISNLTNNSTLANCKNYSPMAIDSITNSTMSAHYEKYEPIAISNAVDSNKLFYDDPIFIEENNNIKPITIEKTKVNKQTFFQPQTKIIKVLDDIQVSAKNSKKISPAKQ